MLQKLYRYIFWIGSLLILVTAFVPITGELNKKHIGPESFHIRLDYFLHLVVYFLICLYFLVGLNWGLSLFARNSLVKFILLILFLATITELVQLWVPERAFNTMDLIANVTGIVAGLILILITRKN